MFLKILLAITEKERSTIEKIGLCFLAFIYLTINVSLVWPIKLMWWLIKASLTFLSTLGGLALLFGGKGYHRK